ncbi:MAG TPA: 16S rRNA (guanine(966)-N(2))-methyltransferase RsmD, partial [Deltaproteobacteria bacterium]|nr:16S rRNA (guanine(966)-N(2))-methyltransferase RsmD [Deltaproteobacteria bacterium]
MLQVTGGSLRGRRLKIAPGESIRPTASRVREALFSILGQRLDGRRVLDLYAGAGTLGIEAASRGADDVVFVEVDGSHVELLRHNARLLDGVASHRILGLDVQRAIQRLRSEGGGFDLVFLDAPYGKGLSTKTL